MEVTLLGSLALSGCADPAAPAVVAECTRNGVCDDGVFCNGEERCVEGRCAAGEPVACDDGVDCTTDSCDETRWACRHQAPDADADGYADAACKDQRARPLGDDCDDADPSRHPGAPEVCDPAEIDEDCDPSTVGETDLDDDGATSFACCNTTAHERECGPDCDDTSASVGPDAPEVCDGVDNDCNGRVDEDVELLLFRDEDGDNYGAGGVVLRSCTRVRGYASEDGDCDDADPAIYPGAAESCGLPARDRDCNGERNDLAGGCACDPGSERRCPLPGPCSAGVLKCIDEVWSATCTILPAPESCNGIDDDCDGEVDDGVTVDCYADEDGDGYAAAGAQSERSCPLEQGDGCPQGSTARPPLGVGIDCAPQDRDVSPGAPEICNGKDDDCDQSIDEGLPMTQRFIDNDGDGHAGTAVQRCASDPTSQDGADDCMDDNALVYPGQAGVFATPACARGFTPCLAGGAAWRCKPAGSDACDATLDEARWDYDCDDDVVGEPFVTDPCQTADSCGGGCGQSGFLPTATPDCGSTQTYQVCRCVGAQGGGCSGTTDERPYPCH